MKLFGNLQVLTPHDEEAIHRGMLRIVSEVGLCVEHAKMLDRLADFGGGVDRQRTVVRFTPQFVERFIAESEKFDWAAVKPQVTAAAVINAGKFLDPVDNQFKDWTLDRILAYIKVARNLEHVSDGGFGGCGLPGVPPAIWPLHDRYLAFKYGYGRVGSIQDPRLCPFILEMCEAMAEAKGGKAADYFSGSGYLSGPLKLARIEAEESMFCAERGLRMNLGHMTSAGGSAPVTLAGALVLFLAETIFLNIIARCFFGGRSLALGCGISVLDMAKGYYPYARPERQMWNVAMAQMARRYQAAYSGHCGHSDAKRPSAEAGCQKALTTIPTLLACGRTHLGAGLLSGDEVFSPIQMIIDNEFVGALKHFAQGFEVSDETLALGVIQEVGPGGQFMDNAHTLAHWRTAHWQPKLWTRESFSSWAAAGARMDADKALDVYRDILTRPDPLPQISEAAERRLLGIMAQASAQL